MVVSYISNIPTSINPSLNITSGSVSFSLQVLNCNYPITDLEVSTDGAQTWEPTVRQEYNYFERDDKTGFGKDEVIVRVSCANGNQVIIPNVTMDEREILAPVNC